MAPYEKISSFNLQTGCCGSSAFLQCTAARSARQRGHNTPGGISHYMARRPAPISASSYSAVVRQLSYAPSAQRPSLLVVLEHEKSDDQCLDVATSLTNQDSANGSHFSADCGDELGVSNQPEIQKLAFHRRPPVSRLSMRICLHPSGQCGVSSLSNWSWAPRLAWS